MWCNCFEELRVSRKISLWWKECRVEKKFLVELEEAKKKGDQIRVEKLNYQYSWDLAEIRAYRRLVKQEKAIRKADRLCLPISIQEPAKILSGAEDENWYFCAPAGAWLLKDKALTHLWREIRREQKEKRDSWIPWVSLLIALCGSFAAALGAWLTWLTNR